VVDISQEQALISAAQRGDEQAFGALYDAYVEKIYQYVYNRVQTSEIAQDLTADVFVRVVEGLSGYKLRGAPFLSWLYRIAHARLVDYYRLSGRQGQPQDIDAVKLRVDEDMDEALMTTYHANQVRSALQTLTPEQQNVIVLRFTEGYSLQKTADLLGKTVGAVSLMQHRALQALSRTLKKQGFVYDSN
jgi:RNA polymerase sigma-70 factor (ECF subfamily)